MNECAICEHYEGEHAADKGPCHCDVLVAELFTGSKYVRCMCPAFQEIA